MRTVLVLALALSVLALACAFACPSFAEEPAAEAAGGHGAAGHGDSGGSLLNLDLPVAVSTIVVFVLLVLILSKTAWKPILTGLQAREKGIRDAIEGAEKANTDAKALLAEYQTKVASAAEEARKIVEEGRRDAEALKAKIHGEAVAEAGRERDRALRDIEIARQGALKDIYDQVAVVATDVAGRILQQRLDPAGHRRLVDEAVAAYEGSRKAPGSRA
jgi:F-type H+-transporting ATPase subunit b